MDILTVVLLLIIVILIISNKSSINQKLEYLDYKITELQNQLRQREKEIEGTA